MNAMQQCLKNKIEETDVFGSDYFDGNATKQAKILLLCFNANFQFLFTSYARNSAHSGEICSDNARIDAVNAKA